LGENWLNGWANRIEIVIDHNKIDANLVNFPILVHLSTSSGLNNSDVSVVFDELQSDNNRKKIAVTTSDGETQCFVEIGYWSDSDEQAALWVKVPNVSSTTDTTLYLYYDHTHVDNTAYVGDVGSTPGQNVWDSNYVSVFHLTESSNGTAGEFKDSTSNHNDGQGGGSGKNPTRVINELGLPCQLTDGVNDYILLPYVSGYSVLNTGDLTVEFMTSPHTLNHDRDWRSLTGKWDATQGAEWWFELYDLEYTPRPQWISFYVASHSGLDAGGNNQTGNIAVDQWVSCAATAHCTDAQHGIEYVYVDGVHNGAQATWESYNTTYIDVGGAIYIGNRTSGGSEWVNARFYEYRISKITRSQAWINASNYSNKDNLLTFETLSSQQLAVTTNAASGLTTTGATLNANLTSLGTSSTVTVSFEYGLTNNYGNTIAGVPPTMTSTGTFSASLSGLTPNTLYHYRAKAVGDETSYGNDRTFTTKSVNNPPVLNAIGNKTVNEGSLLRFTISATDPDGDTLTYSTSNLPSGANFNSSTRTFSWTPRYNQAGVYTVRFQVSDGELTDYENVTITVVQLYDDWDVNGDGVTNVLDITLVGQHWGESGLNGWIREDVNEDGTINVLDIIMIGQHLTE
jgi:hypothetical protein